MYKFKVEKMNCMSCFHNINDALKEFNPSIRATVEVKNKLVIVETSETSEQIAKLIEKAGYPVEEVL